MIAKALNVKPLILGACSHITNGLDANGMLFWNGTPVDPEKNPVKAFDALFGGQTTTPPVNADVQLRKDLLAFTASEVQGLQTTLQSLTAREEQAGDAPGGDPVAAGGRERGDAAVGVLDEAEPGQRRDGAHGQRRQHAAAGRRAATTSTTKKNFQLLLAAQLELITQAIICNAAPVIGLMPMFATCDFDFGFASAPGSHHTGPVAHACTRRTRRRPTAQYNSPIDIAEPARRRSGRRSRPRRSGS